LSCLDFEEAQNGWYWEDLEMKKLQGVQICSCLGDFISLDSDVEKDPTHFHSCMCLAARTCILLAASSLSQRGPESIVVKTRIAELHGILERIDL
jgi:hypothetical protein